MRLAATNHPGGHGAHLDAQFPVALQCINVPLSLPLPACLSFSLSPSFSLSLSLSLSFSPSVWGLLNCSSVKREGPSVLLHHPERGWNWCASDDRAPSVSVICPAQHHRLGRTSDINPLCVSRSVFQRRRLVSRANYVIWPQSWHRNYVRSTCTHKPLKGGC